MNNIIACWNCGQKLRINTDKLSAARCGNCQQPIQRPEREETKTEHKRTEWKGHRMKEYKVVSAKEKSFWDSKVKTHSLETMLNELAREGWRVVSIVNQKEDVIVILERDK